MWVGATEYMSAWWFVCVGGWNRVHVCVCECEYVCGRGEGAEYVCVCVNGGIGHC